MLFQNSLERSLPARYATKRSLVLDCTVSLSCIWVQQTNVGTGLRASVHMQLPNLSRDGTDIEAARLDAIPFFLNIDGMHATSGTNELKCRSLTPEKFLCIADELRQLLTYPSAV